MTKKILCPVDFSPASDRALDNAAEMAKALGAEVELLHIYQMPILALPDAPVMATPTFIADITDAAGRALAQRKEQLQALGVGVSTHLMEGNPAEAIAQRAHEMKAAMIVMATHGRSGFRRFLLGSVAERVVRVATVPVLTVHLPE
jgi:nucleotide-binding universal stress UspA family protein